MEGPKRIRVLAVPVVVAVIVLAALLSGLLESVELLSLDFRLRVFADGPPAPVALVAIDSDTIKKLGRWPIPRGLYGEVMDRVSGDGARGILVDIDFSSQGPDPEQDRMLVEAVRRTKNVVLAVQMVEKQVQGGALIRSVSLPMESLMEASSGLGSITFEVDPDGVVRRVPKPIDFVDEVYYPMGIVGAGILDPGVQRDVGQGAMVNMAHRSLAGLPIVSFSRVLDGEFEEGTFRGRVVLLGATTPELHDFWVTPMGVVPGVYLQAALMETALNRSWHSRCPLPIALAATVLASLLLGQFLGRWGWLKGLLFLAGYLLLLAAAAALAAAGHRMIPVVPLAAVALLQYPIQVAIQARGAEKTLALSREKTEAILKFSELERAEEAGRDGYLVPLMLLRQVLHLEKVHLFRTDGSADPHWRVETVLGEEPDEESLDPQVLKSVLERREILTLPGGRAGRSRVYVPMVTSRLKYGVLFAEGPWKVLKERENLRLLLSYATQASYFLETWELDRKVKSLYANTIKAITRALDSRDHYTSAHSELSLDYVVKFGRKCGLGPVQIEALHVGTLLHDIGKIGVPDKILRKKGALKGDEIDVIRQHPVIGHEIIRDLPFPADVKMIVLHHHEKYDGGGYPDGLKGEQIPLLVRVFSVLDTYEALIGVRPYKEPMNPEKAKEVLRKESGSHFDPAILETFLSIF